VNGTAKNPITQATKAAMPRTATTINWGIAKIIPEAHREPVAILELGREPCAHQRAGLFVWHCHLVEHEDTK
jgi:FtsP/CotA-like multicopper oxidase with cupredoxin domain